MKERPFRVLLDEHVDWRLSRSFGEGFEVDTVDWRGRKGKRNGELLTLARKAGFDVFLTTDRGIAYQQNVAASRIAIVSVGSRSNRLRGVFPIVEGGLKKIRQAEPGEVTKLP